MKFSTLVRAGVFSLATSAIYPQALTVNGDVLPKTHAAHRGNNHHHVHAYPHPVAVRQLGPAHRKQMDQIEAVVPGTVQFHPTNVSAPGLVNNTVTVAHGNETGTGTSNGTGTGNGNVPGTWPYKADNITACTAPTYENTSPLRTKIVRDDCHDLAKKVLTQAGYWTMYQWTGLPGDGNYTGLIAEGTCQFAVSRIFDEKLVHDQGQGAAIFGNVSSAMNNNNVTDIAVYVFPTFSIITLFVLHFSSLSFPQ